jgi:hypothetical protein
MYKNKVGQMISKISKESQIISKYNLASEIRPPGQNYMSVYRKARKNVK